MRSLHMARGEGQPIFNGQRQAPAAVMRGPTRAAPVAPLRGPAPPGTGSVSVDPYLHSGSFAHSPSHQSLTYDPYSDPYGPPGNDFISEPIMGAPITEPIMGYGAPTTPRGLDSSEADGSSDVEPTPRSDDESGPNYGRIIAGVLAVAVIVPLLIWLLLPYVSAFATTTPAPHDCNAGYSTWETTWSTTKKMWCCKEHKVGCPALVTAADQPPPPPQTPPACHTTGASSPAGSGLPCVFPFKYNGVSHSKCTYQGFGTPWCATKVHSGEFLAGQWGKCSEACEKEPKVEEVKCDYNRQKVAAIPGFNIEKLEDTTAERCQNVCSNHKDCKAIEFATTRDAGPGGPAFYPSGTCLLQSTAEGVMPPANRYKNLDLYTKFGCKTVGAPIGTGEDSDQIDLPQTTALPPGATTSCPYDCSADYNDWPMQWVKGWSGAKKVYCCKTANRGCPDELPKQTNIPQDDVPGLPEEGPYNCKAAYNNCYKCIVENWSTIKMEWCCKNKGIGCKPGRRLRTLLLE